MKDTIKFCADCKHYEVHTHKEPTCARNQDVVNGNPQLCREMRYSPVLCGQQARWFEPKEKEE